MKRVFFLLIACMPVLSFAQESKVTHYIDYSAGYTYRAKMSGLEMQLQYGLGVVKHFDVVFALNSKWGVNTQLPYRNHIEVGDKLFITSGISVGGRAYCDFAKICTARLSLLYGVNYTFLERGWENELFSGCSAVGIFSHCFDGKAELLFRVSPKTRLGLYYDYTLMLGKKSGGYRANIHSAGIAVSTKLN